MVGIRARQNLQSKVRGVLETSWTALSHAIQHFYCSPHNPRENCGKRMWIFGFS